MKAAEEISQLFVYERIAQSDFTSRTQKASAN